MSWDRCTICVTFVKHCPIILIHVSYLKCTVTVWHVSWFCNLTRCEMLLSKMLSNGLLHLPRLSRTEEMNCDDDSFSWTHLRHGNEQIESWLDVWVSMKSEKTKHVVFGTRRIVNDSHFQNLHLITPFLRTCRIQEVGAVEVTMSVSVDAWKHVRWFSRSVFALHWQLRLKEWTVEFCHCIQIWQRTHLWLDTTSPSEPSVPVVTVHFVWQRGLPVASVTVEHVNVEDGTFSWRRVVILMTCCGTS